MCSPIAQTPFNLFIVVSTRVISESWDRREHFSFYKCSFVKKFSFKVSLQSAISKQRVGCNDRTGVPVPPGIMHVLPSNNIRYSTSMMCVLKRIFSWSQSSSQEVVCMTQIFIQRLRFRGKHWRARESGKWDKSNMENPMEKIFNDEIVLQYSLSNYSSGITNGDLIHTHFRQFLMRRYHIRSHRDLTVAQKIRIGDL